MLNGIRYTPCHKHNVFVPAFSVEEVEEAYEHGRWVHAKSLADGRKDSPGADDGVGGERIHEIGALAERVAARALKLPWEKWVDTFKDPDLSHNIEVRCIGVNSYGLRVYRRDHNSRRVVGVVIEKGRELMPYRMPGWIVAGNSKKPPFLMDPNNKGHPFYGVPQNSLRPLSNLIQIVREEEREEFWQVVGNWQQHGA